MRPRASLLAAFAVLVGLLAAGCGGTSTYDADKTRACLEKQPGVLVSDKVDFIASNVSGGAFSATFDRNEVTLSFTEDRTEAQRVVRIYRKSAGKNIGLRDVLRPTKNVVALWAAHPGESALQTIRDCLK